MRYHSDKHYSEFLPTRWQQKSTGINVEQNCITVTLCIKKLQIKLIINVTEKLSTNWKKAWNKNDTYTLTNYKTYCRITNYELLR